MNEDIKLIRDLGYDIEVKRTELNFDKGWLKVSLTLDGEQVDVFQHVRHELKNIGLHREALSSGNVKAESYMFYGLQWLSMKAIAHSIATDRVELHSIKNITDKYEGYLLRDFSKELDKHGHSLEQYKKDSNIPEEKQKRKLQKPSL